ncbi:hypothetical protein [Latilactobacillus phage TMW 1.706 P1]|nr:MULTISPECIES: hypothetical protein [Latilactobacillus]WCZ54835.1 hypothetical protein [Latilactobacillus phage TMW 1.706 P1]MCT3531286.1 hypothetical protein [Latilactobacillus curvatus]MDG2988162.1 hypothetical protein [Latilactobacillus curvatus]QAS49584.1 hypothetical protein LCU_03940 [Latilactobacillus curvatus JCM 1096 = DSM 20019]BAX67869.1 hypothetical protein LASAK_00461 [Latilactobacillus sakei]
MSIRDRVNSVKESWNVASDGINDGYQGLESGEYLVMAAKITRSDWDTVNVRAEVIEGENTGTNDFISLGVDELKKDGTPLPDFVIDRNIKTISKLAYVLGVDIPDEAWDDVGDLVEVFKPAEGGMFKMILTVKPNKKRPEYPFKEYDFEKVDANELPNTEIDVADEDIPF